METKYYTSLLKAYVRRLERPNREAYGEICCYKCPRVRKPGQISGNTPRRGPKLSGIKKAFLNSNENNYNNQQRLSATIQSP